MKSNLFCIAIATALLVLVGCASAPKSFVRGNADDWTTVELRNDIDYEQAWREAVDVIAKKFELEVISKEGGYARTVWIHTWWKPGQVTRNYRVRAVLKFTADHKKLDLKTEAQYLDGEWNTGTDSRLLNQIKQDIMGVVGRTTR